MIAVRSTIRAHARKSLYRWACRGPVREIGQRLLARRKQAPAGLATIAEGAMAGLPLAPAGTNTVAAPRRGPEQSPLDRTEFPAIEAHRLGNVLINPYSSSLVKDGTILVPPFFLENRHRIMSNAESLGYYDREIAVCATGSSHAIDRGIFVGGNGSHNWYHFLIECLPKAFAAGRLPAEFADYPLLVPREALAVPSFADAIAFTAPGRELVAIGAEPTLVRDLVMIDEISLTAFNLYPGLCPELTDFGQHDELMRDFARAMQRLAGEDGAARAGRKLFLRRKPGKRDYNQDELIEIAAAQGFEAVILEQHPLREQARLFAEADYVVGASGAGWANMIFAGKPFGGLSWLPPRYMQFSSYSMLAQLLGHRLRFVEARPARSLFTRSDFYGLDYNVPADSFKTALDAMLRETAHG